MQLLQAPQYSPHSAHSDGRWERPERLGSVLHSAMLLGSILTVQAVAELVHQLNPVDPVPVLRPAADVGPKHLQSDIPLERVREGGIRYVVAACEYTGRDTST